MDNVKYLVILLLIFPACANASILDMQSQSPFFRDSSGNFINTKDHAAQLASGKLTTSNQYSFGMPDGKRYGAVIPRDADFDLGRVGSAVGKFANRVGPVVMVLAAAELVCELADICPDGLGGWETPNIDPQYAGYPTTTPQYKWSGYGNETFPTPETACNSSAYLSYVGDSTSATVEYVTDTSYKCTFQPNNQQGYTNRQAGCAPNYTLIGSSCTLNGVTYQPATAQDFADKASELSHPDFVPHLLDAKEPIPITSVDSFPPVNTIIGTTTKQIKDSQGNITGTEVTERRMQITDASSPTEPNLVDVKEERTVTTYDINNNPTGSTVETSEAAPPVEPPVVNDTTVAFDDVSDEDLEEYEFPDIFSYESWGEGSCPPDRAVSYGFGTLNLAMTPACDFAQGIRPIILIIAGLTAMFIISGIKTE